MIKIVFLLLIATSGQDVILKGTYEHFRILEIVTTPSLNTINNLKKTYFQNYY